ncbi:hypothetical protein F4776DRAFT_673498 [Hypoxylon sp. NC0597]|nr:hypothetical protein F4776DRAFT_673498 [Hypoxylon sp. NC0597]
MAYYASVNASFGDDHSDHLWSPYEYNGREPNEHYLSSETEVDSRHSPLNETRSQYEQQRDLSVRSQTPVDSLYKNQGLLRQREGKLFDRLLYWKWEIGACLLILIAISAILATLYPHEGRPQPNWPYLISVNSLLSVYGAVFKAALAYIVGSSISQLQWRWYARERSLFDLVRYDSAGRGPLGSLQWLWTNHLRQPLTAFGATLTIVAIAIDPFIQQLVSYDGCSIAHDDELAALPRTNYFVNTGVHIGAGDSSVTPELQAAVNSGVFSPGQPVSFSCSTGNCTFPETFATVGYCSKCQDISDTVQFSQHCYQSYQNMSTPVPCASSGQGLGGRNLTASIPGGISVNTTAMGGTPAVAAMGFSNSGEIQFLINKADFSDSGNTIGGLNKTELGCNTPEFNNKWPCRGWGAASCTLEPCVRVYQSSIDAGVLSETALENSVGIKWGTGQPNSTVNNLPVMGLVDTKCITPQERDGLVKEGYKIDPATRWLGYNTTTEVTLTMPAEDAFPASLSAHNCLYNLDYYTNTGLFRNYLGDFFTGTITGQWAEGGCCVGFDGPQALLSFFNFTDVDFEDVDRKFGDVADSLTRFARENGNPNRSNFATGQVLHYETCLNVRWGWIAMPAALAALTLIFFILTIITTERYQLPIWKSNPLAFVFHGPGGPGLLSTGKPWTSQDQVATLNTTQGMELASKDIVIKLEDVDGQAHLTEVQRHSEPLQAYNSGAQTTGNDRVSSQETL